MKTDKELKKIVADLRLAASGPSKPAILAAADAIDEILGEWRKGDEVNPYDPNFPADYAGERKWTMPGTSGNPAEESHVKEGAPYPYQEYGDSAGTHDPSAPTVTDVGKPELGVKSAEGGTASNPRLDKPEAPTPDFRPPFTPGPNPGKVNTTESMRKPI